ncbi:MAG: hypothetical protein MHMPM18_001145, partial [Marteilia pararefringens]
MEGYQPTDYSEMISPNYLPNYNEYMIDYQEPNFQNYYEISFIQRPLEMPMTQRPLQSPITQRPGFGRRIIPQQYRMPMRLQAPFGGSISQQQFPMPQIANSIVKCHIFRRIATEAENGKVEEKESIDYSKLKTMARSDELDANSKKQGRSSRSSARGDRYLIEAEKVLSRASLSGAATDGSGNTDKSLKQSEARRRGADLLQKAAIEYCAANLLGNAAQCYDRAAELLNFGEIDHTSFTILSNALKFYGVNVQYDQAEQVTLKLIDMATEENDVCSIAKFNCKLANIYELKQMYGEAAKHYDIAYNLYRVDGYHFYHCIELLEKTANLSILKNDFEAAAKYFLMIEEAYHKYKSGRLNDGEYIVKACLSFLVDNPKKSTDYFIAKRQNANFLQSRRREKESIGYSKLKTMARSDELVEKSKKQAKSSGSSPRGNLNLKEAEKVLSQADLSAAAGSGGSAIKKSCGFQRKILSLDISSRGSSPRGDLYLEEAEKLLSRAGLSGATTAGGSGGSAIEKLPYFHPKSPHLVTFSIFDENDKSLEQSGAKIRGVDLLQKAAIEYCSAKLL